MTKSTAYRHYRLYMLRKDLVTDEERSVMEENLRRILSEFCDKHNLDYRNLIEQFNLNYCSKKVK